MYLKRNNEMMVLKLYTSDHNAGFYLREISRLSKLPLKTVQNVLGLLEKEHILKSSVRGKNKYFFLNTENIHTKLRLLEAELWKTRIFAEKYPACKMFLKKISTKKSLLVFGSFAKLTAGKDSDFDLLILSKHKITLPAHLLPYKLHQIYLSEESFAKALQHKEPLIQEIQQHHVIINNYSFYVEEMWTRHTEK